MVVLRWFTKPRINYIDVLFAGAAYGFWNSGKLWTAVLILFAGIVVSVLAERLTGENRP